MVIVKYFYEQTDSDYEDYDKQWDENKHRFNFLDISRLGPEGIAPITINKTPGFDDPNRFGFIYLGNDDDISSRDILAIRFPHKQDKKRCDHLLDNIIKGHGIVIGGNTWLPKEVWIYM